VATVGVEELSGNTMMLALMTGTDCHVTMSRHLQAAAETAACRKNGKMVNGSRFYRALESVSIASALSSALTPFTHARSESIKR